MKAQLPPVVILAGGLATRLHPITLTIPKSMVIISGKPFIDYQLRYLASQGIKQVVICVGHLADMLIDFVGNGARYGLDVVFSKDGEQLLGTGGALKKALELVSQNIFWVTYGDSYLTCNYSDVFRSFDAQKYLGLMTIFHNQGLWDKSNVVYENQMLKVYDKKKLLPEMQYIDYGLSILSKQTLSEWSNVSKFDLADVFCTLVQQGKMAGYEVKSRFYEVGSHSGVAEATHFFANL